MQGWLFPPYSHVIQQFSPYKIRWMNIDYGKLKQGRATGQMWCLSWGRLMQPRHTVGRHWSGKCILFHRSQEEESGVVYTNVAQTTVHIYVLIQGYINFLTLCHSLKGVEHLDILQNIPSVHYSSEIMLIRLGWARKDKYTHIPESKSLMIKYKVFTPFHQLGMTLKEYPNSTTTCGVSWGLSCSFITGQFLLSPALLPSLPHKCCVIVHSAINLLHANIPESVSWGTRA